MGLIGEHEAFPRRIGCIFMAMTGFGDFAGSDSNADDNDEAWDRAWAGYTSGNVSNGDSPVLGRAELPIGVIEIRGAAISLEGRLPPAVAKPLAPSLVIDVESSADGNGSFPVTWRISKRVGEDGISGQSTTMAELIEAVTLESIRADTETVYLDAVLVDNGEIGIAMVGLEAHGITALELKVDSLVSPWWVISEGLVAIRRRTRTVTGLRLIEVATGSPTLVAANSSIDIVVEILHPDGAYEGDSCSTSHGERGGHDDRNSGGAVDPCGVTQRYFDGSAAGSLGALVDRRICPTSHDDPVLFEMLNSARVVSAPMSDVKGLLGILNDLANHAHERKRDPRESPCAVEMTLERLIAAEPKAAPGETSLNGVLLAGPALDALDRGGNASDDQVESIDLLVTDDRRESFARTLSNARFVADGKGLTVADLRSGRVQEFNPYNSTSPVVESLPGAHPHSTLNQHNDVISPVKRVTVSANLAHGPFAELVDMDDFHEMSVEVRVGRHWIRGLHPAHRYIDACLRLERNPNDHGAIDSAKINLPVEDKEVRRVAELAERCGALSVVREATLRIRSSFPDLTVPLLKELGG